MQTNRALRATAMIMFGWVGLRGSFLLMSSNAETYAPLTQQAEAALPVKQPVASNHLLIPLAEPEPVARIAKPRPEIRLVEAAISQKFPLRAEAAQVPTHAFVGPPLPIVQSPPNAPVEYRRPQKRQLLDPVVSAWAIVRPVGSGPNLATNGQLGASQAGVRIQQPLLRSTERALIALNLRLSTPLDQKQGSEAGIGLSVRPIDRLPIELIFERRVALDRGGRNALAVIAAGGFDDKPLIKNVSMSGYAQTGIVGFVRGDGFVDGAVRVERIMLDRNRTGLRIGGGLWGAAQPDVARIDIGPILAVKQRLGTANLRISAEYRWRVAGQARPASGPALSIGTDF